MNRYTKSEDSTIIKAIKNNPGNLDKAFEHASKSLSNRNSKAISQHWYNKLSKSNYVIGLRSSNTIVKDNRKNVMNSTKTNTLYSVTKSLIGKLNNNEKASLLNDLINEL